MMLRKVLFHFSKRRLQSSSPSLLTPVSSSSFSSAALFIAGDGWTGAFGTGPYTITSSETSTVSTDDRENNFQEINFSKHDNDNYDLKTNDIVNVAAGWGHTALITSSSFAKNNETKLYVAGRPYDFQALLRLNRLPSFLRNNVVSFSLRLDEKSSSSSFVGSLEKKIMEKLAGGRQGRGDVDDDIGMYRKSVYPCFEEVKLPNGDMPIIKTTGSSSLAASAGFTAVIGKSGKAYTFGLNRSGQCGVGKNEAIHIWEPTPLDFSQFGDNNDSYNVTDVALGLQHGLVLKENGSMYAFGKGTRGQLGATSLDVINGKMAVRMDYQNDTESSKKDDFAFSPISVQRFVVDRNNGLGQQQSMLLSEEDSSVLKISAGWNHSGAITKSNHAWIWGKNVIFNSTKNDDNSPSNAMDSPYPVPIKGLPNHLAILDISCGSHHTSILMEDGSVYCTGISTDENHLVGGQSAIQIIPPGIIDLPIVQFKSHFDRTTIVAGNGQQVLEVQLWSNDELRQQAVFEPAWVENIKCHCHNIKYVHRGWLHTVVLGQII